MSTFSMRVCVLLVVLVATFTTFSRSERVSAFAPINERRMKAASDKLPVMVNQFISYKADPKGVIRPYATRDISAGEELFSVSNRDLVSQVRVASTKSADWFEVASVLENKNFTQHDVNQGLFSLYLGMILSGNDRDVTDIFTEAEKDFLKRLPSVNCAVFFSDEDMIAMDPVTYIEAERLRDSEKAIWDALELMDETKDDAVFLVSHEQFKEAFCIALANMSPGATSIFPLYNAAVFSVKPNTGLIISDDKNRLLAMASRDIQEGDFISRMMDGGLDYEQYVKYGIPYDESAPRGAYYPILKFPQPPLRLSNTVAAHPAFERLFASTENLAFFFLSKEGVTVQDYVRIAVHFIGDDVLPDLPEDFDGEEGTGKDLIARFVNKETRLKANLYIATQCKNVLSFFPEMKFGNSQSQKAHNIRMSIDPDFDPVKKFEILHRNLLNQCISSYERKTKKVSRDDL